MDPSPSVDDLRLVAAVTRTGSVGAAARELRVSQPSASQRLGRLERRIGLVLFDRDTQGARPTVAGREMAHQAEHILGHLGRVYDVVRTATAERELHVGSFDSIAASLFPVLDAALEGVPLRQRVDHGDRLVEWVGEGTMDAAFVCVADQLVLPRGVQVHQVGGDTLVLFLPTGVPRPRAGRQPLRGLATPYLTYDLGAADLHTRLADLGARPRRGATVGATLAMARRQAQPAVVPRSALAEGLRSGEQVAELPFTKRLVLSMVSRPHVDARLVQVLPHLRAELGLVRPRP
ncbi:LysR family transcriptional regulator [Nocardioides panaciterrulae]|uniref:DNA-binding transcriptional LysR family regulator n=1 Tax=Nocardioides panaciterrulae TaxID=661492 RepID=A0A7Y9JCN9_9ACTN|nr:LysR family transcriptional regulator [Nocardioides panaciterrulae]NYD43476.1 DNA-binding transcriptional LysR family regulator [Nocardioides panaciterrulae]